MFHDCRKTNDCKVGLTDHWNMAFIVFTEDCFATRCVSSKCIYFEEICLKIYYCMMYNVQYTILHK